MKFRSDRRCVSNFVFSVLMLAIAGCRGDDGSYKGPTGEVTGKVTFDGKAIPEGSQVIFQATQAGHLAAGIVSATGEYTLQYNGTKNVPTATYQVVITPPSKSATNAPADPVASAKVAITTVAPPFPAKYSTAAKDRTFTVKEGKNSADFPLSK